MGDRGIEEKKAVFQKEAFVNKQNFFKHRMIRSELKCYPKFTQWRFAGVDTM